MSVLYPGIVLNFSLWLSSMARCPINYRVSLVISVRPFEKINHSPCFVVGSARFLCFIFPKFVVRETVRSRGFNGLIIIDKVMQGGIIG